MSDCLGIGPLAALAVLSALTAALIGYLLRRRTRRGRHSMRHHKYQVREILARVEREQPRSELEPAPVQLASERVRVKLNEPEPPTEVIPRWPTTDPDRAETVIDVTDGDFTY